MNYEVDRPLSTRKNKKVTDRLMKNELGGKIMTEFVAFRPKTYPYLMDDDGEAKKTKGTKKMCYKKGLKFSDYEDCLLNNEIIVSSQQRFKIGAHSLYTEEVNKIALSSSHDKRLQISDRITSYPFTNENKSEHNLKWPYIPDHPYRILIIGGSGSGKTNALLNLINNQPDIDKIYLYVKDPLKQNINI